MAANPDKSCSDSSDQPPSAGPETASEPAGRRDVLLLCACHLQWRSHADIRAYGELLSALDDSSEEIRKLAEALLHRPSPRPGRQRAAAAVTTFLEKS